jgi:hypothetical protein
LQLILQWKILPVEQLDLYLKFQALAFPSSFFLCIVVIWLYFQNLVVLRTKLIEMGSPRGEASAFVCFQPLSGAL